MSRNRLCTFCYVEAGASRAADRRDVQAGGAGRPGGRRSGGRRRLCEEDDLRPDGWSGWVTLEGREAGTGKDFWILDGRYVVGR